MGVAFIIALYLIISEEAEFIRGFCQFCTLEKKKHINISIHFYSCYSFLLFLNTSVFFVELNGKVKRVTQSVLVFSKKDVT